MPKLKKLYLKKSKTQYIKFKKLISLNKISS